MKVPFLILFMDFENSWGQILSFAVLRIHQICLSVFQIQDLGQSISKSKFFHKDINKPFSLLFPSVLLSYLHQLKAKLGMYFTLASIWVFERCVTTNKSFPCLYWRSGPGVRRLRLFFVLRMQQYRQLRWSSQVRGDFFTPFLLG